MFVLYSEGRGYLMKTAYGVQFSEDLQKARTYSRRQHATCSASQNQAEHSYSTQYNFKVIEVVLSIKE